mmetsp:Transcript_69258/g.202786  ORF Transcript_69258/g.202786 Transcript_69258/m.202786 type:complete len:94 (-) Transcript_69258:15-296(-)
MRRCEFPNTPQGRLLKNVLCECRASSNYFVASLRTVSLRVLPKVFKLNGTLADMRPGSHPLTTPEASEIGASGMSRPVCCFGLLDQVFVAHAT